MLSVSTPQLFAPHTEPSGNRHVGDQRPVRADDAVEAVALAQEAGDHVAVEAEADLLRSRPDRPAVVGHDLRRPGVERRLEGQQVVLEHASRVDLVLAVREVRIFSVLLRAAAGKVLRHARDRRGPECVSLEPADVGGDEPAGQLRVLSEGVHDPGPPRLGREICHRMKRDVDPDGAVLAGARCRRTPHDAFVAKGSKPIGSGQWKNPPPDQLGPIPTKLWRGSDEIVTGIPSRVDSASR